MKDGLFPKDYTAWEHCIVEDCGIELTKEFVETRLKALTSESSAEFQKFAEKYGTEWTNRVVSYFKQAQKSLC